jgi:hypothetical protein
MLQTKQRTSHGCGEEMSLLCGRRCVVSSELSRECLLENMHTRTRKKTKKQKRSRKKQEKEKEKKSSATKHTKKQEVNVMDSALALLQSGAETLQRFGHKSCVSSQNRSLFPMYAKAVQIPARGTPPPSWKPSNCRYKPPVSLLRYEMSSHKNKTVASAC